MTAQHSDDLEDRVDRVFAALGTLTDADLMAMSGHWTGGDTALRQEAWSKVRATDRKDPRSKALEQSRDRVARWVNDLGITWAGAYERSIVVPAGADQGNLRRNAVPPILDAIVAALFADVLDEDEREELSAPLLEVTQPGSGSQPDEPELDQEGDDD